MSEAYKGEGRIGDMMDTDGKTIAEADCDGSSIYIRFTDGMWYSATASSEYDGGSYLDQSATLDMTDAHSIGLVSDDDYQAWKDRRAEHQAKWAEDAERRELAKLKAKYEGQS